MGNTCTITIGNRSKKTILYRFWDDTQFELKKKEGLAIEVGVPVFTAGCEYSNAREYAYRICEGPGFSRLKPGHWSRLDLVFGHKKRVFVTIKPEDEAPIWHNQQQTKERSLVITEDLQIRTADKKKPLEIHPDEPKETLPRNNSRGASREDSSKYKDSPTFSRAQDKASTKRKELEDYENASDEWEPKDNEVFKSLSVREKPSGRVMRNTSRLRAKYSRSLNIKDTRDMNNCSIWGLPVKPNGTLLLADSSNWNIKALSPDGTVLSALPLKSAPWAITLLDARRAYVAGADETLYVLDILNDKKLSVRDEHKLRYRIHAMTHYNGKLVATCDTSPKSTRMMHLTGGTIWSADVDESGQNLFLIPSDISKTTINHTDVIVVTDNGKDRLVLLTADRGVVITTIDVLGKTPHGITADNYGNFYVCYNYTGEISVWSNDLGYNDVLLDRDQLDECPFYIAYNGVNDSLYISYSGFSSKRNTIDIFRLS